jgi:hypothetical protein
MLSLKNVFQIGIVVERTSHLLRRRNSIVKSNLKDVLAVHEEPENLQGAKELDEKTTKTPEDQLQIPFVSEKVEDLYKLLQDHDNFPSKFYVSSNNKPVHGVPFERANVSPAANNSNSSRSLPSLIDIDMAQGMYQVMRVLWP